jgi:hypothetical protein
MADELKSWVADPLLQVVFWTSEKVISNDDLNTKEHGQHGKGMEDMIHSQQGSLNSKVAISANLVQHETPLQKIAQS